MNLRDEIPNWSYRKVKVTLTLGECMMIKKSIMQFANEVREALFDFFKEKFAASIDLGNISKSYEFFTELENSNTDIQEIKSLEHKERERSEKPLDFSVEYLEGSDNDFFGFASMGKIGTLEAKEIEISLELNALVEALRVAEAYKSEVNFRDTE